MSVRPTASDKDNGTLYFNRSSCWRIDTVLVSCPCSAQEVDGHDDGMWRDGYGVDDIITHALLQAQRRKIPQRQCVNKRDRDVINRER